MIARPPAVAWPTLALATGALSAVAGAVVAVAVGALPWWVALALSTAACFAGFTGVHESAHHNVCRIRWLNDAVGHLCALLLTGALLPYRALHREHHRHTNDPARDPDHWGGRGPRWALPLRWATQDLAYLAFYARRWSSRPALERADLVGSALLYAGVGLLAAWAGHEVLLAVVTAWFLPARIALVALACTFGWLPHAPHVATDRYRATTVRSAPLLNALLLGQSFHLVHHLYPRVPFYRLAATWRARRAELVARGAVDHSSSNGLSASTTALSA